MNSTKFAIAVMEAATQLNKLIHEGAREGLQVQITVLDVGTFVQPWIQTIDVKVKRAETAFEVTGSADERCHICKQVHPMARTPMPFIYAGEGMTFCPYDTSGAAKFRSVPGGEQGR